MSEKSEKVVTGSEMKGLFSRPPSLSVTVETKKYGNLKFEIRPLNNEIYAKMGEVTKNTDIDIAKPKDLDNLKVFSSVYYPVLKVVLPYCCINPKVVDGASTDQTTLSLNDMPIDVMMLLMAEIMKASGISEEAEEARKN